MNNDNYNTPFIRFGRTTCLMVFVLGIIYAVITTLGLISLQSPQDSIGNPYFTIMEILSILISVLMMLSLTAVYFYDVSTDKYFSLTALILMCFTSGITTCVHFLVLSISHSVEAEQLQSLSLFLSFKWPSVVYVLDILAWDFFYGLSMLFASQIFNKGRYEKNLKVLLFISGILSLIGLIGIPLQNIQIRNIGIIGYAVIGPVAFFLIGKTLGRTKQIID